MGAYFVPKHMHALCHWWLYDEDSFVGFLFSAHFVYDNGGFEQEQEPHHLGSNHSSTTDKFHDFEEITLPWNAPVYSSAYWKQWEQVPWVFVRLKCVNVCTVFRKVTEI